MLFQCERCKKDLDCKFYGTPSSVDEGKVQNGEWLCRYCVQLRQQELDEAIESLKRTLRTGDEDAEG